MIFIRTMLIFSRNDINKLNAVKRYASIILNFQENRAIYVSKPVQVIIGYVEFSGRIPRSQWTVEYQKDLETSVRMQII